MMPTMQGPENTMHRATVRKVVAAFDSFKGCLSAREACEACAQGIGRVLPHAAVVQLPLSAMEAKGWSSVYAGCCPHAL